MKKTIITLVISVVLTITMQACNNKDTSRAVSDTVSTGIMEVTQQTVNDGCDHSGIVAICP